MLTIWLASFEQNISDVNNASQLNHLTVEAPSGRSAFAMKIIDESISHISISY
jgi:hypothetical protein